MFDLVVATNNEEVLARNLLMSPLVREGGVLLQEQKGYRSASLAYNDGLRRSKNEIVIFAHQDVYLPAAWENEVNRNISYLETADPNWAVLGVYGVRSTNTQVGYVWSSGLNGVFGGDFIHPVPVISIDELLIIVKRSSGVKFDDQLPGFHLYGTDIVQTALARKRTAYVISAPVVHNSLPCLYLGSDYFAAHCYLTHKWKANLPLMTCVAPIVDSGVSYLKLRFRHWANEYRYRHISRRNLDRGYNPLNIAKQVGFE